MLHNPSDADECALSHLSFWLDNIWFDYSTVEGTLAYLERSRRSDAEGWEKEGKEKCDDVATKDANNDDDIDVVTTITV